MSSRNEGVDNQKVVVVADKEYIQPGLFDQLAAERVDRGIEMAEQHNESVNPGWEDQAMLMLVPFVHKCPGGFLARQFLAEALKNGLDEPTDRRAMGSLMRRAKKDRLVVAGDPERDEMGSWKTRWIPVNGVGSDDNG